MLELISELESESESLISAISELIPESRYFEPACIDTSIKLISSQDQTGVIDIFSDIMNDLKEFFNLVGTPFDLFA